MHNSENSPYRVLAPLPHLALEILDPQIFFLQYLKRWHIVGKNNETPEAKQDNSVHL